VRGWLPSISAATPRVYSGFSSWTVPFITPPPDGEAATASADIGDRDIALGLNIVIKPYSASVVYADREELPSDRMQLE
jgi:hypothetical protein